MTQITHDCYGDESYGSGLFSYAFLILQSENVEQVAAALGEIKKQHGKSPNAKLHCREIFSPQAKAKTEWADLALNDIVGLYRQVFESLNSVPHSKIVVATKIADLPIKIEAGPWQHRDKNFVGPMPEMPGFSITDKFVAAFCGRIALTEIAKTIPLDALRVWADPDTTKIALAGQNRQAGKLVGGTVLTPDGWAHVKLMDLSKEKPALIETADAIAYLTRRSQTNGSSAIDKKVAELSKVVAPQIVWTNFDFKVR